MQGYMTNSAAVATIGTSFALAKLITLDTMDAVSQALGVEAIPRGAILSHLRINGTSFSGVTDLFVAGWTDAAGDDLFLGPSDTGKEVAAGLTTAAVAGCVIPTDPIMPVQDPTVYTANALYIGVRADAGTFSIPIGGVELHWYIPTTRGS